MKKLNTILLSIWGFVFLYSLICININATSWLWVIGLILIFFGMVIVCIVSGVIGFSKYGNALIPALINATGTIITFTALASKGGEPMTGISLLAPAAFLITLISAGISFVFKGRPDPLSNTEPEKAELENQEVPTQDTLVRDKPSHPIPPIIRYPLMGGIIIGLYLLLAYCSQFELFPVEKEKHWKEITPPADAFIFKSIPKELWKENHIPEYYIFDKDSNAFTGIIERYYPHLRINPFQASPKGVEYYMNGQRWGNSVAGYKVTEPFDYNYHNRIKDISFEDSFSPYLIYLKYTENVNNILDKCIGDYIILSTEDPYQKILLSFDEKWDKVNKVSITYHTNRIISDIEWKNPYTRHIRMDRLGFINKEYSSELLDIKLDQKWKREDFVLAETLPDPIQDREVFGEKRDILINNIHLFLEEHPEDDPEIANLFLIRNKKTIEED